MFAYQTSASHRLFSPFPELRVSKGCTGPPLRESWRRLHSQSSCSSLAAHLAPRTSPSCTPLTWPCDEAQASLACPDTFATLDLALRRGTGWPRASCNPPGCQLHDALWTKHTCTKNAGNTLVAFVILKPTLITVSARLRNAARFLLAGSSARRHRVRDNSTIAWYRAGKCLKLCLKNADEYTIILVLPGIMIFGHP